MFTRRALAFVVSLILIVDVFAKEVTVAPPAIIEALAPEYPAELLAEGAEGAVEMRFGIDEHGAVRNARVAHWTDERFKQPCLDAVGRWKFEAQKLKGQPKDRAWFVIIEFKEGNVAIGELSDRSEVHIPPKALEQVPPVYPEKLIKTGNVGKVVIKFVVDESGRVRNPEVVTATHPAFERPAIAALIQWKFAPGTIGGRPVQTRMQLPISFAMDGPRGAEAFEMRRKSSRNLPEALKVDVPPKPKVTVFVVHPYEHAISGASGTAEVKVLVGPNGTVIGSLVEKASKPEYGLALAAAMEAWTFEPALRDNKPSLASISRKHTFETRGRDSAIDNETAALASLIRKGRFKPASAKELDAPLRPSFTAPPVYPTSLLERGVDGTVKIEVIVDTKGRAVLPRIVEASEPEFGWAAATAVQRWRFEPPTVNGKAVEVKVMIPVKFTAPEPEPEERDPASQTVCAADRSRGVRDRFAPGFGTA